MPASCSGGATNYTVHEGEIGNWYSHTSSVCTASGTQLTGFNPSAGDRYFLVVPTTADTEGSYGTDSAGNPRPASTTTCLANQIMDTCP